MRRIGVRGVAGATLVVVLTTGLALAAHPRPKGATPVLVSLVPAFKQCTTPNSSHGAPLAAPSCTPTVGASSYLTVGTADAGGGAANATGFLRVDVKAGSPGPPDDSDLKVTGSATDVRCRVGAGTTCGFLNSANGPDYTGELEMDGTVRVSDHYNGSSQDDPATMVDLPFPVPMPCTGTDNDPSRGSDCGVSTTANVLMPGLVVELKRAVVEAGQLHVNDGGADGVGSTGADNTLYLNQGIFIP
jgi:hypothetical protein